MITVRIWTIISLFLLLGAAPTSVCADMNFAQQGAAAFKRGAYDEALEYFARAERAGERSESVAYNIAVCLYRLRRFEEARTRFLELSGIPKWRDLAHYNLGLVDEAAGDRTQAGKWYRLTAQGQSEKLRLLAERKLSLLGPAPVVRDWMALLSFGFGRDSNAASLADEMQLSADDNYKEWLAYAQTYLDGQAGAGLKFYALGFDRRYERFESLDSQVAGFGLSKEFPWQEYAAETGLRLTRTLVDSRLVADQLQASLGLSRSVGTGTFSLKYLPSRYFSGDRYAQIDGWQQRLEAGWRRRFDVWTLETRYRYEINDRDDLRRDDSFSSYSPRRNGVLGKLDRRFGRALDLSLALEYTRSRYPHENRLRDTDGSVRRATRAGEQIRLAAGLGYGWNRNLRLKGEYEYIDTQDNFELYTYDKSRLNAALEYQF
jgi:tetratricopeptide (TPR) repeat protein